MSSRSGGNSMSNTVLTGMIGVFIIGCTFLCLYYAMKSCGSTRRVSLEDKSEHTSETERRKAVLSYFEKSKAQMEVTNDALDGMDEETGTAGNTSLLRIPSTPSNSEEIEPSSSTSTAIARTVPNLCAICLEEYKVGEFVVWSCSRHTTKNDKDKQEIGRDDQGKNHSSCQHVYHRKCMVDYLISCHDVEKGYPCPTCRREYLLDINDDSSDPE